ncbi:molybdopterin-dependent oxidoreductase [Streptomyces indicus]|uniref:Anaerobic selenocysteine-containing dehydrogenase n=1 Tax=Streptomyces indicus TaxID=417292 RepID=A0A1G8V457_9ACTN|nr:molybdopterin-dependent oxidoreductase [Streptomyces indicus]SDJ60644.1 Anaerobic selenocysteine-containing dehydrogenase [Streptomyces indicus]
MPSPAAVEQRGYCTLCKSRCGAIFTVENGRLTGVRPDPEHPTGAAMCPKGRAAPEIAHSTRRLTTPLRRTRPKSDPDPGWEPVTWDEALDGIAARLTAIAAETGPESVAFGVATPSGTMVSDATEWIERFVRGFGSPNTVYSAELCNWHKDTAHTFTFGTPLPPPDYAHADLALLWGFNPAKTWLAQSAAVSAAQARGMRLAVVDPRRSTSALAADHWLRIRPGTDAALALGLAHLLIEHGWYDEEFVRTWTNGPLLVREDDGHFLKASDVHAGAEGHLVWNEETGAAETYDTRYPAGRPERFALRGTYYVPTLTGGVTCVPAFQHYADACAEWTPDRVARTTWIPEREIRALAEQIGQARSVTYYGWTGVAQSANATQTERALATLYALTGSYDTRGGNHVAPPPPYRPAAGQLAPEQRAKALGLDRHPLGPQASGYINAGDLCRAIEDQEPYPVRALMCFGSNLVVAQPDSDRVARALGKLDFQVHLDLFENPTSATADYLLPVSSAYEHEGLRFGFETGHRAQEQVQLRPRIVEPQGEARSDTEVVFALATRMGMGEGFFGGDIEAAWDWQLEPLGLTAAGLRARPGGVRVPRPLKYRKYAECCADGTVTGFATPTRRVELYSERLLDHGYPPVPVHREPAAPDPEFPLVLTNAKHGYFLHSQQRGLTTLRRRAADPCLDLSPETAAARGIAEGQWVELATRRGAIRLRARFDDSLHPSVVVGEYGWWQQATDLALPAADPLSALGSNYNRLVDHSTTDPLSGSVPLRSQVCEVRPLPADGAWPGRRTFTVTAAGKEGRGVRTLSLAPVDGGRLPDYRPGQHLTVRAEGSDLARSYSLTGPAVDADRAVYTLAIRRIAEGAFSSYAHDELRIGDRLELASPGGVFAIPTHTDTPVVLVAGGIGITPFLSYVETLAASGGTVPEVVLHYGNAHGEDHPFRARITELCARIPQLKVLTYYANPLPYEKEGRDYDRRGFITADAIAPHTLVERRARFYFCGPEPMIESLTAGLHERGVPRFEIFSEKFRPAQREVPVPEDARFTVRFARSGREVEWAAEEGTLLELGERAGVTMRSGCRVGQCESCACTVLKGDVAHRVVPSDDLPASDALTCQSVPLSDVVLDA